MVTVEILELSLKTDEAGDSPTAPLLTALLVHTSTSTNRRWWLKFRTLDYLVACHKLFKSSFLSYEKVCKQVNPV